MSMFPPGKSMFPPGTSSGVFGDLRGMSKAITSKAPAPAPTPTAPAPAPEPELDTSLDTVDLDDGAPELVDLPVSDPAPEIANDDGQGIGSPPSTPPSSPSSPENLEVGRPLGLIEQLDSLRENSVGVDNDGVIRQFKFRSSSNSQEVVAKSIQKILREKVGLAGGSEYWLVREEASNRQIVTVSREQIQRQLGPEFANMNVGDELETDGADDGALVVQKLRLGDVEVEAGADAGAEREPRAKKGIRGDKFTPSKNK